MKRSEAARYARWSAATALLLGAVTAAVYVERAIVARIEKSRAPAAPPKEVSKLVSGITFSKVDGNKTLFTVQASKSTDFKGKDLSLLEDVRITIFGDDQARHDVIHTQSCQYGRQDGTIVCSGPVEFDLLSAVDAGRAKANPAEAAARTVHVETRAVTFNRESGTARTAEKVNFRLPNGTGEAFGVDYKSTEGVLRLLRDVRMNLAPPRPKVAKEADSESVQVRGSSMEFERESRKMRLFGPAEVTTAMQGLMASEIILELDQQFHAERLEASGAEGKQPELRMHEKGGESTLTADKLEARFTPEGAVRQVAAKGNVHGARGGAGEQDEFSSAEGVMDLWPKESQPRELNLQGSVMVRTRAVGSEEARLLQANAIRMSFREGGEKGGAKPEKVETLGPGSVEWTEAAKRNEPSSKTKLQGEKLEMEFDAQGKSRQLQATGKVQVERAVAGRPTQTATAQRGAVQFQEGGGWSRLEMQDDVRLKEGERSARGGHAVFDRAEQTATLTEKAVVRDAATETHAARVTFLQATGEIAGDGGVQTTDLSPKGSAVQLANVPANITAGRLRANSKTGRAVYSGNARLWQGDAVMQADAIELQRDTRTMIASGRVRGALPQTTAKGEAKAGEKKTQLWHVSSELLTYRETENKAHLEKNVVVEAADQRIRGDQVDLYFVRGAAGAASAAGNVKGAQQISHAVATGGVIVEQGARKATAERGEYTAEDGKFVMSGGQPTLYDGAAGSTTGRQLTFFLASDTIIVDSETGSRTLTKHRVDR